MIKTKIFVLRTYHHQIGNTFLPVNDYLYCLYVFGFLVRAVPVNCVNDSDIRRMLPGIEITDNRNREGYV